MLARDSTVTSSSLASLGALARLWMGMGFLENDGPVHRCAEKSCVINIDIGEDDTE